MSENVTDAASIVQMMIEQIDRPEQRYNCTCQVGGVDALSIDTDWLLANLRDLRDALAAHQPARVVPSAEEVADLLLRVGHVEWDKTDARNVTEHILALFASQPTAAEVREQVAREIEAAAERIENSQRAANGYVADTIALMLAGYAHAARQARGEA